MHPSSYPVSFGGNSHPGSIGVYQQPNGWNQYPSYMYQSSMGGGMNPNMVNAASVGSTSQLGNSQLPSTMNTSHPYQNRATEMPSSESKNAYFGNTSININFPMYMTPMSYPPMGYPQRYTYHNPYQNSQYVQSNQYPVAGKP